MHTKFFCFSFLFFFFCHTTQFVGSQFPPVKAQNPNHSATRELPTLTF